MFCSCSNQFLSSVFTNLFCKKKFFPKQLCFLGKHSSTSVNLFKKINSGVFKILGVQKDCCLN